MLIFEPHIHMFSRITDDYEKLSLAGVRAVLEPAFWLGQNRTSVGTFIDYYETLIGWERHRAQQFGIHHFCTMGLNPREANDDRMPSWPIAIPSVTVIVVNSRGVPSAALTPILTDCACLLRAMLHGAASFQQVATPTKG